MVSAQFQRWFMSTHSAFNISRIFRKSKNKIEMQSHQPNRFKQSHQPQILGNETETDEIGTLTGRVGSHGAHQVGVP